MTIFTREETANILCKMLNSYGDYDGIPVPVMVGNGELYEKFKELCKFYGIRKNVDSHKLDQPEYIVVKKLL